MKNRYLAPLILTQLLILLISCEVPSEIDKKTIANQNPAGSITFPVNGSIVNPGAPITIKAQASDPDGQIAKVEFYLDVITNKIGEDTTAPYEFTYTAGVDGSLPEHKLYVAVTDVDGGYRANLTPTTIKVNNLPTCTITSPSTNAYYAADSVRTIDIFVNASDTLGTGGHIDSVVFKIDNRWIHTTDDTISANTYGISIPGNLFNSGKSNLIEAIAYDTHGGKATSSINLNIISSSKIAFYDGFEGYSNFNIGMNLKPIWAPSETFWTQKDLDQAATWGFNNINFQNSGYTGSYIIFNPSKTTPAMPNISHDGNKFAACFNAQTNEVPVANKDWLITKKIAVPADGFTNPKLSLWVKTYSPDYFEEEYTVYYSIGSNNITNGNEISSNSLIKVDDFVKLSPGGVSVWEKAEFDWTNKIYTLPNECLGKDIYVAVACRSYNHFVFMLDDIMVFDAAMPSYTPKRMRHSNDPISKAKLVKKSRLSTKRKRK